MDAGLKLTLSMEGGTAVVTGVDAASKSFDRLVIAAPLTMLGALRQALHKQTQDRIAAEEPKDLVKIADRDLRPYFADVVAF